MAKREKVQRSGDFVLFDVLYEDDTRSNRKVPSSELGSLDGDTPAKPYIETQDRTIAAVSENRVARSSRYRAHRSGKSRQQIQEANDAPETQLSIRTS
jgi:hypothetical protein